MTIQISRFEALKAAVEAANGQSQFARDLGTHQPTVLAVAKSIKATAGRIRAGGGAPFWRFASFAVAGHLSTGATKAGYGPSIGSRGAGMSKEQHSPVRIAIDIIDLGRIQAILAAADQVEVGDPATSPLGQPRFKATASLDEIVYTVIGERRKAGVTIVSMWKRGLRT